MRYVLLCLALAACGGGGSSSGDAGVVDDDAPVDAAPTQTSVVMTMMATRTLDSAYFGLNGGDSTIEVEIYKGAIGGCPNMDSPTPEYTLLIGALDPQQTMTNGSFVDYIGDMLPDNLVYDLSTSFVISSFTQQAGVWVSFDLDATFQSGTGVGHVYATHCASLDT